MSRRTTTVILAVLSVATACSGSSGSFSSGTTVPHDRQTTTVAGAVDDAAADRTTVWLCGPGVDDDPCTTDRTMTLIGADGSRTVEAGTGGDDRPVDCFYVYPTVSTQPTAVANLDIEDAEIAVAKAQASRFSEVCRVFAPMYRQRTIRGIFGAEVTEEEAAYAYDDVRAAWHEYVADDNDGRGVILIGHSQGTFVLTKLLADEIEPHADQLDRLVAAYLIGGNVTVAEGSDTGGSFRNIPVCSPSTMTGCIVAWSAFPGEPPADALFGKAGDGKRVVCTDPATLAGNDGPLRSAFVTGESLLGGIDLAGIDVDTPWVGFPDRFRGECRSNTTHDWFRVTTEPAGSPEASPELAEPLGPGWGLHLVDVNVALGDLVALAKLQAEDYAH